jgi:peptidoglycan/xylan/chitin deacetylase (PgdA/CDA1 family)
LVQSRGRKNQHLKTPESIQNALLSVCLVAASPVWAQFQSTGVITAAGTPKRSVFLTFDDGPDERGPDGLTQIEKVATYLQGPVTVTGTNERSMNPAGIEKSIRASFAIVACHFIGQDKAASNSSMCTGYGDIPESVAANVLAAGHDIFNHSQNHLPLTGISTPAQILYEVGHAQIEIDKLRGNSPRLFRAPGLAWSLSVASVLNGDPSTDTIQGPVDADVGAAFQVNLSPGGLTPGALTWIGGDWDCFALKLGVPFCGELYVNAIHQATAGVVVLLHVRTEWMDGSDGNPFILNLTKYIVEHLGAEYEYLPLDAIPKVRGDLMTAPAAKVSAEFGPGDGQGMVAAGAISGTGKSAGICKARNSAVVCKTGDGLGGFAAATPWLTVNDPTWFVNYGSALWLADINGDGMADLIYPASGMLWVGFNNGQGAFSAPVAFFAGALPDPQYIKFGKVSGDGRADMVVWTPGMAAPAVYWNNGVRFAAPTATGTGTALAGAQPQTMQLIDINGDGREDLVVRGSTQVGCALSTGQGFGALTPCSIAGGPFAQSEEWWNAAYGQTFAVAHIDGPVVVDGQPTGLIFAPFSNATVSHRYRYLCNDCFTNSPDADWRPERQASQIVWADLTGKGVDSPLFVRADGLYLGLTPISTQPSN